MAEVAKKTRTVTTTDVTLTLTLDEAETLMVVLGSVVGSATASPRKHTNAMYVALKHAGVRHGLSPTKVDHPAHLISGYLTFHNSAAEARSAGNEPGTPEFLRKLGY